MMINSDMKDEDKKDEDGGVKDSAKLKAADHIKITDLTTGRELVNKRG